ncbi:protein prenylyltransferase, partial [Rhizoclosmatium globosum]
LDASAIAATTQILELNPDAYSAWNLRRRVLVALWSQEDINAMAHQDLKFIEKLVRVHPKSYWLWLHRGWILDHMPSPDWSRELKLVQMMLDLDPRNFHGWDYRRQVLKKAGKAAVPEELEYSMGKINQNFSNYSAWHYRSKLIPRVFANESDSKKREAVIEKDFEVVRNAIYTEPADQSAWLYQRWLLGQQEDQYQSRKVWEREMESIRELVEVEPDSKC